MDTHTRTKKTERNIMATTNKNKTNRLGNKLNFGDTFFSLRLIGHVPFRTGEIIFAFIDVFDIDVVVFVFQFARIGDAGVFIPFAASLELVRL